MDDNKRMISFKPRDISAYPSRRDQTTVRVDGVDVVCNDADIELFGATSNNRHRGNDEENQLHFLNNATGGQRASLKRARRTSSYMELRRLIRMERGGRRRGTARTSSVRSDNDSISAGSSARSIILPNRATLFTSLIILVGLAASTLIFGFGIASAVDQQAREFDIHANGVIGALEAAWKDYEVASRWTHQSCRNNDFTRQEFRDLHEYLTSDGLRIQVRYC